MLDRTTEAPPPISLADLQRVESVLNMRLPDSYREFLLNFNGGRPIPSYFLAVEDGKPQWMRVHFLFGVDDPEDSCDMLWNYRLLKERIPNQVVAIARDEGGNRFCLDLRREADGPVLFWDHEKERLGPQAALSIRVANTFSEWIGSLSSMA